MKINWKTFGISAVIGAIISIIVGFVMYSHFARFVEFSSVPPEYMGITLGTIFFCGTLYFFYVLIENLRKKKKV